MRLLVLKSVIHTVAILLVYLHEAPTNRRGTRAETAIWHDLCHVVCTELLLAVFASVVCLLRAIVVEDMI